MLFSQRLWNVNPNNFALYEASHYIKGIVVQTCDVVREKRNF